MPGTNDYRAGSVSGGDDAIQGDKRQPLRDMYATGVEKSRSRLAKSLASAPEFFSAPRPLRQHVLEPEEPPIQAGWTFQIAEGDTGPSARRIEDIPRPQFARRRVEM